MHPAYKHRTFHVRMAYVLLKYSFASSLYNSALAASSGVAGNTDATSPLPLSPILGSVRAFVRACLRADSRALFGLMQPNGGKPTGDRSHSEPRGRNVRNERSRIEMQSIAFLSLSF